VFGERNLMKKLASGFPAIRLPTAAAGPEEPFFTGPACFIAFLAFVVLPFWFWSLVDCLSNEPSQGNEKLVWLVVILLLGPFGSLLYLCIRRPQRIRDAGK
jgi:hypothetical protein